METLEEQFKNMHLLDREERLKLLRKIDIIRPGDLRPFFPVRWLWKRCNVKVLIVTDGGLNFGTGEFGLSEFLTTFNELQRSTWYNYQITLGHRSSTPFSNPNTLVVATIPGFNFASSVTLNNFDQVWLFGINSGAGLPSDELAKVEDYMNNGGGLFATGDHGTLGSSMCSNIPRVKDMRHWADFGANEVGMTQPRRNDTNRPKAGDATSLYFDNQSDNIPQNISVRIFGTGLPHPLLSIKKSVRPSGLIDIMPDHPHEGECKPETSFTANGVTVSTQNIATSFVLGGSTVGGGAKALTIPHSFSSIAVWDGRLANVGRIVVDSTWHHFVNVNLNGVGSTFNGDDRPGIQSGLTTADFNVIRQYFMNIALWITRRKLIFCLRKYVWYYLLKDSQLIEASLNHPIEERENISIADLNSIGALAEEILSEKYSPAFARDFLIEALEPVNPNLAYKLNIWKPDDPEKVREIDDKYYQPWVNLDFILHTAIGAGFIALRDDKIISDENASEKDLDSIIDVFNRGVQFGFDKSVKNLGESINSLTNELKIQL
ncbi:hypothetical protein [Flavobacterium sp. MDT1-60]|uniref:hypothetical protein n=1 Tax=Flavobacterium sp. MDT1-60 TaxID=1979344 RepID=UPI00177ACCC9|nr:hypothetical protein [Flavobacterium sp. MDT1-60]QOG00794.1 hypothetical protein IHE43_13285 [Flavobacterium sp. MDT1-60]